MDFKINNQLNNIAINAFIIEGISVSKKSDSMWQQIQKLSEELRRDFHSDRIGEIAAIKTVRQMFKKESIDPSRYRPSSEALLRRVLKNQDLYQINSVVDTNNYCSLKFLLPMGVYDLDLIEGIELTFRTGKEGESYQGIGKDKIDAKGKIVMVDQDKICGSPISDSENTKITRDTKNILVVIYSPTSMSTERMNAISKECEKTFSQYLK